MEVLALLSWHLAVLTITADHEEKCDELDAEVEVEAASPWLNHRDGWLSWTAASMLRCCRTSQHFQHPGQALLAEPADPPQHWTGHRAESVGRHSE